MPGRAAPSLPFYGRARPRMRRWLRLVLVVMGSLAVCLVGGALMAGLVALVWPVSVSTLAAMAVAVGLISWLSLLVGRVQQARRNGS